MKKTLSLLLALAMVFALAVGGSTAAFADEGVTLKFQQWWGVELPEGYLQDIVDKYEADTGVKVELLSAPWSDTKTAITAGAANNTIADIISVDGAWLSEFVDMGIAADADNHREDLFTKPDAAEKFCRESGVDSLAVSIGNAHGEYKETPHLDIRRLEEIHAATDVPLVLHGGSGIPDDQLLVAFSKGINKFNLGTDFLRRYFAALTEFTAENGDNPDPVKVINMPAYVQSKLQPYVEDRLRTLCHF